MKFDPLKVIWNDWPALASSIAVPIVWAIQVGFPYLRRDSAALPLWFPLVASVALVAVLLWRIGRVGWLFSHGASAVGVITDLAIAKDRGLLKFHFDTGGTRVRAWMPIHRTRAVLSLSPGDRVEVLFDGNRPKRAIVRSLYEK